MADNIEKWIADVEESLYGGVGLHVPLGTRPQVAWERSEPSVGEEVKGEAKGIITSWLQLDGGSQGENPVGVSKQKKASSCDMSPDWSCDMDIQSTVSSIVGHLMSKELDLPTDVREEREERRRVDPKRAMERRHKRVQEKRRAREAAQRAVVKETMERREARKMAEQQVLSSEKKLKEQQKAEETLLQLEMAKIRKQMQEERSRQQLLENVSLGATRPHPQGEIPANDTNSVANPINDRFNKKSSKSVKMASEKEKVVKRTASSQQDTIVTEASDHSNSLVFPSEVTRDWKARKMRGRDGRRKRSVILSSKASNKDETSRQDDTEGGDATTSSSAVTMTTISTTSVPNLAHMEKLTVSQHKQKLRVLRRCYTTWYNRVSCLRMAHGRAVAMADWRLTLLYWKRWKEMVLDGVRQKETDLLEKVKNDQRLSSLATNHYHHILLIQCYRAWRKWLLKEKVKRDLVSDAMERQSKMAALLEAVRSGDLGKKKQVENNQETVLITSKLARKDVDHILSDVREKKRAERTATKVEDQRRHPLGPSLPTTRPSGRTCSPQVGSRKEEKPAMTRTTGKYEVASDATRQDVEEEKSNPPITPPSEEMLAADDIPIPDSTDETANSTLPQTTANLQEFASLNQKSKQMSSSRSGTTLKEGLAKENSLQSAPAGGPSSSSRPVQQGPLWKEAPKPPPVVTAMERRTAEIARRKEERERRRKQFEEEKEARLKEEEERKQREAVEAHKALLAQKKKERELAKQKEVERQRHVEEMRELHRRAGDHYRRSLQVHCMRGWTRFISTSHEMERRAEEEYKKVLCGSSFACWMERFERRIEKMEEVAERFHQHYLIRDSLRVLREHVKLSRSLERQAAEHYTEKMMQKHVKAWLMYVTEERLSFWEKEQLAAAHYTRSLKMKVIGGWRSYVPMSKYERGKEKRRNELRLRVASWLPDYDPLSNT